MDDKYNIQKTLLILFLCYTAAHQIPRDDYGRIKRNPAAVREFKQQTGYTQGRTGYQIDHVTPLHHGGCDTSINMQWLSIEEHKRKSAP
jgi:hypothetical protein